MDWPILGESVTWFCVASIDDVRLDVGHCIDAQLSSKISRILVVYSVRDFRRIFFVPALVRYQFSLVASKGVSVCMPDCLQLDSTHKIFSQLRQQRLGAAVR